MTFSRNTNRAILGVTALLWFLAKFVRYVFPPLFESLQTEYGVSYATIGAAYTGLLIVYGLMQFPSGVLADRFGSIPVIAIGTLVTATGCFLLVFEAPFAILVSGMVLIGLGSGVHKTVAVGLLSTVYPDWTGRAVGILDTVGTMGGAAAGGAVVLIAGTHLAGLSSRKLLFLGAGLIGVGLAISFYVVAVTQAPREMTGSNRSDSPTLKNLQQYLRLFDDPHIALFVVLTMLFSFGYNGVLTFLPLYLTQYLGFSVGAAGVIYSIVFLASLVQFLTGAASDRMGTRSILVATTALSTAMLGILLLLGATGRVLLVGGIVCLFGIGAHGYRPVRSVHFVSVIPDALAKGSLGVVRTLLMTSGAVAPVITGYLLDVSGLPTAFTLLFVTMAGATGLAGYLWLHAHSPERY